jgi:hypothetical protein
LFVANGNGGRYHLSQIIYEPTIEPMGRLALLSDAVFLLNFVGQEDGGELESFSKSPEFFVSS